MAETLDLRGLLCPLVVAKARAALAALPAARALVVLATDREAPIDLAALAADSGRTFSVDESDGVWRCTLG